MEFRKIERLASSSPTSSGRLFETRVEKFGGALKITRTGVTAISGTRCGVCSGSAAERRSRNERPRAGQRRNRGQHRGGKG